jgi:hypothetical protein
MNTTPDGIAKSNRIATRHAFTRRIRIHVERLGRTTSMDGWARDMSESGIAAFVAQPLMPDEPVVLEIPLSETIARPFLRELPGRVELNTDFSLPP